MTFNNVIKISVLLSIAFINNKALALVKPAALFSDNMVIQQQAQAAIWGWADVGEIVTVSASWGASASTKTDSQGKFSLVLNTPTAKAGLKVAHTLTFEGNNTVVVNNVLVGEVWLASGQSNMAFTIGGLKLSDRQIGNANLPEIREYTVHKNANPELTSDSKGDWKGASQESIHRFSGTAYFFAHHLFQNLDIPIGIINSSWGGTPIESWLSKDVQKAHAPTQKKIMAMDQWLENFNSDTAQQQYSKSLNTWQQSKNKARVQNIVFKKRKPSLESKSSRTHRYPGNLYAGMIHPLIPYNIKGVIWYQGEANSHSLAQALFYQTQLVDLVTSWRVDWNNNEMPFYVVQLANYKAPQVEPVEHLQFWPVTRESMRKATEQLPHSAMALAIDIGDANNIHPQNKMELGRRLALQALANEYSKELVSSGPLFTSYSIEGDSIYIDFDQKGTGLVAKDSNELTGFAIAGDDGSYVWAKAIIVEQVKGCKFWQKTQRIKVSSSLIKEPKSVKYGWADNPDKINLYNKEGLPASPFSTE